MLRLTYRAPAVRDLRDIATDTRKRWGLEQARIYGDTLRRDIKSLREFPLRFPVHHEAGTEFRKLRSGHHLVFYLVGDQEVEIIRVLHERMDTSTRLTK